MLLCKYKLHSQNQSVLILFPHMPGHLVTDFAVIVDFAAAIESSIRPEIEPRRF